MIETVLLCCIAAGPHTVTPYEFFEREYTRYVTKRDGSILLSHAQRHPNHPSAIMALIYATGSGAFSTPEVKKAALARLPAYHQKVVDLRTLRSVAWLDEDVRPAAREYLLAVAEKHPDPRMRALVWRSIQTASESHIRSRRRSMESPEQKDNKFARAFHMQRIAGFEKRAAEARAKLAAPPFAGAVPTLEVGTKAPTTPATGIDGKPVTLASLKGKVVVLDFWFAACPPCWRSVPKANALIKEMKGRPFAHVGVNVDGPLTMARHLGKVDMTWIHWRSEPGSRFMEDWDPQGYPTFVVIDHEGIIRHHQVGYDPKEDAVTPLVRELVKKAEARRGREKP